MLWLKKKIKINRHSFEFSSSSHHYEMVGYGHFVANSEHFAE